ncbi:MAG: helix-turn-helix transcriptional regulator, partial [Clostridia bacterium]|nr:helix-turn-helix transcriptional regulator [Clostridia bacterium]
MLAPSSYKIRDFIDTNIQADISLDDIASKFFFSKSYIISCFKNEFGISPKQYIIQKKIETAKNMLLETDMSIKAIAEMLHFADSHHFSNTFKKQTGMAPVEFRMKAGHN